MPVPSDLPPLADFVTKVAGIAGFPEPLEVRVIISRATTNELAVASEESVNLGPDGKSPPYIHNVIFQLSDANKRGLERLAYWRNGRKASKAYIHNQSLAEYLARYKESQWPIPPDEA